MASICPIRTALIGPLFKQLKQSRPALSVVTQTRWYSESDEAEIVRIEGYDAFYKALQQKTEAGKKKVFALFTASKIAGRSWCPESTIAAPVVEACAKKLPKDSVFIRCAIGEYQEWKDPNNVFRKDPKLQLTIIPTLIEVGTKRRLLEKECADKKLVEKFFEEN